jgi:hypothetical protein
LTHAEQAIQFSSGLEDRTYLFDALNIKAQIQIRQGDVIAAFDTLCRALSIGRVSV